MRNGRNEYWFSERYGWTNDKYGLSWQVIYVGTAPIPQKIMPVLMFVGEVCGKAENNFYASIYREMRKCMRDMVPGTSRVASPPSICLCFGIRSSTCRARRRCSHSESPWRCLPGGEIAARIECDLRLQRRAEGRRACEASRQPAEHGHDGDRALPAPHGTTHERPIPG